MHIFGDNNQPRCSPERRGSALVFQPNLIRRIPPPTKLGRSSESPVPRPCTSIIAQKPGGRMVSARKASERPARARSQVQHWPPSQELDREKVESVAQKTGLRG